ncbi:hypothetical protein ElyMa_004768000 [Elysia marginata]|uniref:Uncharacterized protein n=1 Tax=Elysia marginata TaxID=1093978 RepID=A0AAV4II46_9GAST|nr:hypothetical protein ElyMa_004768000 [Elysia marginata]
MIAITTPATTPTTTEITAITTPATTNNNNNTTNKNNYNVTPTAISTATIATLAKAITKPTPTKATVCSQHNNNNNNNNNSSSSNTLYSSNNFSYQNTFRILYIKLCALEPQLDAQTSNQNYL